jgi:putative oxidoreductase
MQIIPSKWADTLYGLMRIIIGLLFSCHGAQKLFGVLGGQGGARGLMLVAGIIEFGCGLLIAVGLFGALAAFLASGEMAAAYFMFHAKQGFWPILNKGELAVVYCFAFLYIAARGSGALSIDSLMGRKPQA